MASIKHVLIVGATSAIAIELQKLFVAAGANISLVGRNLERLNALADDLVVRGAGRVFVQRLDLQDYDAHQLAIDNVVAQMGDIDIAVIAHGTLTEQVRAQVDLTYLHDELNANCIGTISIVTVIANYLERQKRGGLCVISSVAGDRGRKSNYAYGAAKAAISSFCQGLRNRLYPNVHVLTVKPGFVNTPMTRNFKKGLLWVEPEVVAKDIYKALKTRRDVIYTPWFWRWIMLVIKLIPERYFKRMSL